MLEQKLRIKRDLTNSKVITLVDDTGVYNESNRTGYGPPNSVLPTQFKKYIFVLEDLITGQVYTHIQSDDLLEEGVFFEPHVLGIVDKQYVKLTAAEFDKQDFRDSIYKLTMYIILENVYEGDGFKGTDVIVNVPSAANVDRNYSYIFAEDTIYKIHGYNSSNLILSSNIDTEFHEFNPVLQTSESLIIFNTIEDKINDLISSYIQDDNCDCSSDNVDNIVELQLLLWGIKDCIDKEDYIQAYEYLKLCLDYLNLNCA